MHTLQETFDISGLAIVEQGEPAYNNGCRYLTADGRRCAAGHLMTASRETLLGEGCGCKHARVVHLLDGHDLDLVAALQQAHDGQAWRVALESTSEAWWSPERWCADWLKRVVQVAREFDLDPSRVLEAAKAAGWKVPA